MVIGAYTETRERVNNMGGRFKGGKKETLMRYEAIKLHAPSGCNADLYATIRPVIGGAALSFLDGHGKNYSNAQSGMIKSSLVKRITNALVAKDVEKRIKQSILAKRNKRRWLTWLQFWKRSKTQNTISIPTSYN